MLYGGADEGPDGGDDRRGEERMRLPVVRRPEGAWTQGVSQ